MRVASTSLVAGVGAQSVWTLLILACPLQAGEVRPSGNSLRLFPDESFRVSENWRIATLPTGKTFHQCVYYGSFRSHVQTESGIRPFFEAVPWAKDAIVRIRCDELKEPGVFKDLLENQRNPIMLFGEGAYLEPAMYPGRSPAELDEYFRFVKRVQEAFGKRFLCFDYCEWSWGFVYGSKATPALTLYCDLLKRPLPQDRDAAGALFDQCYDLIFKRYADAAIPVFSHNNTTLNHYEARRGTSYTGNEIAYMNPAIDGTLLAFCRGAARQYHIPWGSYAAGFGGSFGHSSFLNKSPDERTPHEGAWRGAYTAVPLQEQRRTMYSVYMAGGNFSIKESDSGQGMLAGYNPKTIEQASPRIAALADNERYVGPYALLCSELWDKIVTKHDRGTPYTPVALMFDRNHGLAFKYSKVLAVGAVPYTTADDQMRAVVNTIFPYEGSSQIYYADADYRAGPFGEIFDAITTDAPLSVIDSYRAIVLVGQARVNPQLAGALRQFVEKGGLLLAACEQMTPELWSLAGIVDIGQMGQDNSFLRASDFYVYNQNPFDYHQVKLQGAQSLFVAGKYEARNWPVATLNRVGRGAMIVGTPVWMNVKGDPTRMHGLFSEILTMIAAELAPVRVYGNEVKVMVNRNAAGWVVTLMNNRGQTIAYPGFKPAQREFDTAAVILKPRFDYGEAHEWLTGESLSGKKEVSLLVPPGDIRIVEFRVK